MKSTTHAFLSCMILAVALSTACQNPAPPAAMAQAEPIKAPIMLKTYDVTSGDADRLYGVLQRVLQDEGSVEVLPGEALLVAAPAHIHEGVREFMASGPQLEASPREVVVLDYWLVLGTSSADTLLEPDESADRQLATLKPELDVIKGAEGYAHFRLLDHIRLATLDGEEGSSQSLVLEGVQQTVSTRGDVFEARLKLNTKLHEDHDSRALHTTLRLKAGESVVLGQAGYKVQGVTGSVFYVVRAAVQR
jgi:hypothetical protein